MYSNKSNYNSNINKNLNASSLRVEGVTIQEDRLVKRSLLHELKRVSHEYCVNTSLHCIQYFGERRPIKEKIFWICIFIVSIFCCFHLIKSIYFKWNETPVIVSFSEKTTPVWNIPFPAITICSETKRVSKPKGMSYAKFYSNLTEHVKSKKPLQLSNFTNEEIEEFRTLLHICNTQIINKGVPLVSKKKVDHCAVLDQMMPAFQRYFFYCKWVSYFGNCDKLFMKTYTEEGICYTFNALKATDIYRNNTFQYHRMGFQNKMNRTIITSNRTLSWSLENGFDKNVGPTTYPARVLGSGARAGLFIALQSFKQEINYACRGPIQGFKILLHSPDDVPLVSKQFIRIPMEKEIIISVMPTMITTSKEIANYSPLRRQCFLNQERYLKFFKTYTQSNCELECLANFTLAKCGCVKFSMPRTRDTPVCNEDKIYCYDKAEGDLLLHEFNEGLKHSTINHRGRTKCNCLPACTSLVYNTEISQGNFDVKQMLAASDDPSLLQSYNESQLSRLSVYFKETQFMTSKRSELYGITDLLANCGGIFGLFMGFSFLSLVEIFYHLTLRLWFNMSNALDV